MSKLITKMTDDLKKLLIQNEDWKLVLKEMEERNIYFKTRLADVLASRLRREELDTLEAFHNRFLKQDEQIGLLRHEVNELRTMIGDADSASQVKVISNMQRGIAGRITLTWDIFDRLNSDFSNYLDGRFPNA
ncbi:hypothetical protein [Chitinophaga sp. 212800010-3]|uniref:hypothetical protein n=1 Tax=unclassified Chitinophaga TaxID=2619133 RepID=UPI002DE94837|nr:hypothetical protein [Chitinophaga sp. 212800010-3]